MIPDSLAAPDVADQLASEVWNRIRLRIERRLLRIEEIVSVLLDRPLTTEEQAAGVQHCAVLIRWLANIALEGTTDLAGELRSTFESKVLTAADAVALASLIDDLRDVMSASAAELQVLAERSGSTLLVAGGASAFVDQLLWVATTSGFSVRHCGAAMPRDSFEPAAVLVCLGVDDVGEEAAFLRSLNEQYPTVPVVVTAPAIGLEARAALAGRAHCILSASLAPREIVNEVRRTILRSLARPNTVALGTESSRLAAALGPFGLPVAVVETTAELLSAIRGGAATAVILAGDTSEVDPIRVTQMIRADPATRSCVVVHLVADDVAVARTASYRAGADDALPIDAGIEEIAVRLRASLDRRSLLEPVDDLLIGRALLAWPSAQILIERMLVGAHRQHMVTGLAVMSFEPAGGPDLIRRHEDSLVREFRQGDVIGRLDDLNLVIALRGVGRRTMAGRMERILQGLGLTGETCRVGVTEFPFDGRSVERLVEVGTSLARRVTVSDGPAVASSEREAGADSAPDVLIIDPDQTLAAILGVVLERRGLRVEFMSDGLDALERLTGDGRRALPRALLLEFDLPGLDGLGLLRRLRDDGLLNRLEVLMLSARARETDLRQAFEFGAADVISKPFPTVLFLHRLTRALGR